MIPLIDLEEQKPSRGGYAEHIVEDDDVIEDVSLFQITGGPESSEKPLDVLYTLEIGFEL